MHDEEAAFAAETAALRDLAREKKSRLDQIAALTTFKAILLEGLEVVFVIIALGAGRGMLVSAVVGAALACVAIAGVGLVIRRPLARVPENTLKFAVGATLSAFGVFWTGEGIGIEWPGADMAITVFAAIFLAAGYLSIKLAGHSEPEGQR